MCGSRNYPNALIGNSKGEGSLKAKIFKGKYELKLEFPEGWGGGVQTKKPSIGEVLIFSGTTQSNKRLYDRPVFHTLLSHFTFSSLQIILSLFSSVSVDNGLKRNLEQREVKGSIIL